MVGRVPPPPDPSPDSIRPADNSAAALTQISDDAVRDPAGVEVYGRNLRRRNRRTRAVWAFAILVSIGLHAGFAVGFRFRERRNEIPPEPPALLVRVIVAPPEIDQVTPDQESDAPPVRPPEVREPRPVFGGLEIPQVAAEIGHLSQVADLRVGLQADLAAIQPLDLELPARPVPGVEGEIYAVSDVDRQPLPIFQISPRVSSDLRRKVGSATVIVRFVVTKDGNVAGAYVVSSSHPAFEKSALEAVNCWSFRPGRKAGKSVNTRVEQEFLFHPPSPFQI